jgi:hypothetical protein
MKNIYCLLFFLVFQSIAIAADNDFTIKLKGFPVDGIEWGSSPQQLKIKPNDLECEHIKPSKEECSEFGVCGESEECSFFVNQDGRSVGYFFTNNRLLALSVNSKPADFVSEFAYYNESIGIEPTGPISRDGSEIYTWQSLYQRYKLTCTKSTRKCRFYGTPSPYVEIATKQPAKEKFKLLDLTLGYSTSKDFIQIANANKWERYKLEHHDIYYASSIGMDDVIDVEFKFIDDKLETIVYRIRSKKVKIDYLQMLTKKYGKPEKERIGSIVEWKTNKDTKDEITIGLGYGKTHDIIDTIWYYHNGLSAKAEDEIYLKALTKIRKEENVFQKAF